MPFLLHERTQTHRDRLETDRAYDADWLGRIVRPWQAKSRWRASKASKPKKALGRWRIWVAEALLWLNALPSPRGACGGGRGCVSRIYAAPKA